VRSAPPTSPPRAGSSPSTAAASPPASSPPTAPAVAPLTATAAATVRDAAPTVSPGPSSLSLELALLDDARRAIRAADLTTARRLLAEHRRRFPAGQLAAERARLTEALISAERTVP
jgi:hypothetical protein